MVTLPMLVLVTLAAAQTAPVCSEKTPFNVVDYGAKGDGMADDTPAIQKAINAAAAKPGGGNVVFPKGRAFVERTRFSESGTSGNERTD